MLKKTKKSNTNVIGKRQMEEFLLNGVAPPVIVFS